MQPLDGDAQFRAWLDGTPDEAFALAREFAPSRMRIVQEGFEKRDLLAPIIP